ncbi:MAG: branched-chain amino acid ABC transporter permease [Deltaproteobacteria bacterium]|nr:branched-chain amino acid ABC transporter permease [Deltaproteobacteria bacterium]MBI3078854.1 branched-chain amino acid ABC transporter permease [Deltaproteobacteria bacterium]
MLLQQLINGLTLGSVYALIALGYTMVYGIIELINFAHGEIYMIGAYMGIVALAAAAALGLSEVSAALTLLGVFGAAMLYCGAYGVTMERVAYRPLRQAPRLSPLISALGMSIFLQNYVMLAQGARDKAFPALIGGGFEVGPARVTAIQLFIMATSLLLMFLLHTFVRRTRLGKAMRATAQDRRMAALVGINVDQIISVTFLIGSLLAGAAGVMVALYYGLVNFFIGYVAGIKAFTAAVLGGIGNIPGAMLGGLLLGLIESFGAGYISAEYKDVFAFAILVLVLIFRPAGLLGEQVPQRA